MTELKWQRRSPGSQNNFDLVLENPEALKPGELNKLLDRIQNERHRCITLSSRALHDFRKFFDNPRRPLPSVAFVLLSNWFMTQSGDRNSLVAGHCEALWDALFSCRPPERLSSPAAGQNHLVVPLSFDAFWGRLRRAQGEPIGSSEAFREQSTEVTGGDEQQPYDGAAVEYAESTDESLGDMEPDLRIGTTPPVGRSSQNKLKTVITVNGMRSEVEGSPEAVAQLLRLLSVVHR